MGVNPDTGLWVGCVIFLGLWLVIGPLLALYVHMRTRDRTEAKANAILLAEPIIRQMHSIIKNINVENVNEAINSKDIRGKYAFDTR